MTQSELNRAVSQATGETFNEIDTRGFSLVDPINDNIDSESDYSLEPQMVDWDAPYSGTTQSFLSPF